MAALGSEPELPGTVYVYLVLAWGPEARVSGTAYLKLLLERGPELVVCCIVLMESTPELDLFGSAAVT